MAVTVPDLNEDRDIPRASRNSKLRRQLRSCKQTAWDYCFELPTSDLLATSVIAESVQVGSVRHRLNLQGRVNEVEMLETAGRRLRLRLLVRWR